LIHDLVEVKAASLWRYPAETGGLRRLSFVVKAQEAVCVIGGSGSGIHRVAPLIFGIHAPTSGAVRFMGIDGLDADRRRLVRFIPCTDPCAPIFQVNEYLQWVSLLHRIPYSRARARSLLTQLNLARRQKWLMRRLSPDESTCLRWGAHLAGDPLLIAAENPSKSIGPEARDTLLAWVKQVQERGGGFLFINDQVNHLSLEEKLDPVCYFLYGGRVVLEGSLRDLHLPFRMVTFEVEDISVSDLRGVSAWKVAEADLRVVIQTDLPSRENVRKAAFEAQGRIAIEEVSEKPLYQWLGF
jgi:ABC-type multidrug transport system ATPase subunit